MQAPLSQTAAVDSGQGISGPGSQRRLTGALPSSQCAPAAPYRRCHGGSALPPGSPAPWPSLKRTKPTLAATAGLSVSSGEKPRGFCSQRHWPCEKQNHELKTYARPLTYPEVLSFHQRASRWVAAGVISQKASTHIYGVLTMCQVLVQGLPTEFLT